MASAPEVTIEARLVVCFQEVFPGLTPEEILRATPSGVDEWDSLSALTLVAVIEDEFACRLDDELVAELDSFAKILAALEQLQT